MDLIETLARGLAPRPFFFSGEGEGEGDESGEGYGEGEGELFLCALDFGFDFTKGLAVLLVTLFGGFSSGSGSIYFLSSFFSFFGLLFSFLALSFLPLPFPLTYSLSFSI